MATLLHQQVTMPAGNAMLEGELVLSENAAGCILFSHGSGSSRFSPRNRMVASWLQEMNFGTLLFDLLSPEEDALYSNRFNIPLLTERLIAATQWVEDHPEAGRLPLGYFGASTGAASALRAAAVLPRVRAVVSRGGRPDLAAEALNQVMAPTLLIVGSHDPDVLRLNEEALARMECEKALEVVEGATHLFEEAGTMEKVCELAGAWFRRHLVQET